MYHKLIHAEADYTLPVYPEATAIKKSEKNTQAEKKKEYTIKNHTKTLIIRNAAKNARLSAENGRFLESRLEIETLIDKMGVSVKDVYRKFNDVLDAQAEKNFNRWEWKALGLTSIAYHTVTVCIFGIVSAICGTFIARLLFPDLSAVSIAALGAFCGMPISVPLASVLWLLRKIYVEKKIIKKHEDSIKKEFSPHIKRHKIFAPEILKRNLRIRLSHAANNAYEEINSDYFFEKVKKKSYSVASNKKDFHRHLQTFTDIAVYDVVSKKIAPFTIDQESDGLLSQLLDEDMYKSKEAKRIIEEKLTIKLWAGWLLKNADNISIKQNSISFLNEETYKKQEIDCNKLAYALSSTQLSKEKETFACQLISEPFEVCISINTLKFGEHIEEELKKYCKSNYMSIIEQKHGITKRACGKERIVKITLHEKLLSELISNGNILLYDFLAA